MVGYTVDAVARDRVMKLMQEKDMIENEIREHTTVLETNNVGMQEPLVDNEGYPRSDLDVYKVRIARHRIICLQKDHKEIMKKIEDGLGEALGPGENLRSNVQIPCTSSNTNGHMSNNIHSSGDVLNVTENNRGFATIVYVDNGSPADLAGLCEDDEIIQFGSLNHRNFTDMSQINQLVAHSVGQPIHVQVKRYHHQVLNLTVTPKPWSQPGLLGCQIQRKISS